MRLEDVTAELRPRSDWEAVDLGLALARRDFWKALGCWWLGMLPMLVAASLVFWRWPVLLVLACWWWMPVSSRLVLFLLSRRLFGELPTWRAVLSEWPRASVRRLFFRLVLARFSPWRPLTQAVEDLEGLRKKDYSERVRLLLRRGDGTVLMLAAWRGGLSVWLAGAVFATLILFLPGSDEHGWEMIVRYAEAGAWDSIPAQMIWGGTVSALLALSLVDIFSTGAGFGVYVNHRTWIEGWDVELAFRRLGNRLRAAAGKVAVLVAALMFAGADASLAQAGLDPATVIGEVKANPDFEVFSRTYDVPASKSGGGSMLGDWFSQLLIAAGWLVVAALVGFLIWMVWRNREVFRRGKGNKGPKAARAPVPTVVMGMDVAPETLPDDIPAMALEWWRVGRHHDALGLLYRGAISRLIEAGGVEILSSDTESDCLRRVESAGASQAGYFQILTDAWMRIAYARLTPPDERVTELCRTWPFPRGERRPA